jgi:hypothetical protein
MSAATTTRPRAKPRSKPKLTNAERTAINNENAKKSTGPRTAAGKKKSSFNALKHGLTARSVLLPGEDAAALAARQQHLVDAFQPRNSVELAVIEGMAGDIWRSNRSELALGRRIAFRLRHEPLEQAEKEKNEAVELGGRLFWQPSFRLPISRQIPLGKVSEPLCSENAVHPHHPTRILLKLEQTIPGCDWLIGSWGDLLVRLYSDELWLSADAFKMVRLMGKHAVDMADDLAVTRVFLDSLTLISAPKSGPERESFDWKNALIKMLIAFDIENTHGVAAAVANQCEPFARRLAELPLAMLAPRDDEDARGRLTAIIEQEIRRLRHIRQTLQEIADLDAAEAPERLAFETGPEGDRYRRYGQTNERQVIRRFDQFLKTRTKTEAGEFDSVDVDLQDLLGAAQPGTKAHPAIAPADAVNGEWTLRSGDRGAFEAEAAMSASSLEGVTGCDAERILRNEANLSVVSGPMPAAGAKVEAIGEPGTSGVWSVERGETENPMDEPNGAGENATNEPNAAHENATSEATEARENVTNEATGARQDAPSEATDKTRESFRDAIARIRRTREGITRQLNEKARREAEEAMAARRARRREQSNKGGNPPDRPKSRAGSKAGKSKIPAGSTDDPQLSRRSAVRESARQEPFTSQPRPDGRASGLH